MTPAAHFTQFGKYEIIRKLGRSMTDVYLALDPEANRRVVLKIVEQCKDLYTELVVDAERRGAQIQQQLHAIDSRILEVYEYGDRNGCFFVAMQYAEGRSLAEVLQRETRLDPDRAAQYAAAVCSQLATLHSFQTDLDGQRRAVVHGDIKPSNIQIGSGGEVSLLDFGIAKAISATRNLTQHNLGSPAYCSPERIKPKSARIRRANVRHPAITNIAARTVRTPLVALRQTVAAVTLSVSDWAGTTVPQKMSFSDCNRLKAHAIFARALISISLLAFALW